MQAVAHIEATVVDIEAQVRVREHQTENDRDDE
jgi:hypothetical protein